MEDNESSENIALNPAAKRPSRTVDNDNNYMPIQNIVGNGYMSTHYTKHTYTVYCNCCCVNYAIMMEIVNSILIR